MNGHDSTMNAGGPPPLPVAMPQPRSAGKGRALLDFCVDLGMVIALLLALSTLLSLGWALAIGIGDLASGAATSVDALMQQITQPAGVGMIWLTLLSTGGAALLVYALRDRASALERRKSHELMRKGSTWGWMLLIGLGTLLGSALIGWLGELGGIEPVPTNEAMIRSAFDQSPVFMFVFGALLAPAYEELLFRRVLFGRMWRAGLPWLGLVLSSVAFALIHELPGLSENSWPATLQLWLTYGLMGAAFAWVYRRTGTLWAAIGAHAINNAIACALMVLGYA